MFLSKSDEGDWEDLDTSDGSSDDAGGAAGMEADINVQAQSAQQDTLEMRMVSPAIVSIGPEGCPKHIYFINYFKKNYCPCSSCTWLLEHIN